MTTTKQVLEQINQRLGAIELRLSALGGGKPFSPSAEAACPSEICSFCGLTARQVDVMIAGPDPVFMCCECVNLAAEVVAEHTAKGSKPEADSKPSEAQASGAAR